MRGGNETTPLQSAEEVKGKHKLSEAGKARRREAKGTRSRNEREGSLLSWYESPLCCLYAERDTTPRKVCT